LGVRDVRASLTSYSHAPAPLEPPETAMMGEEGV
jgi:hypothetical protein